MRDASNPLGDVKSRTPATQKAPSVQDYRQRTKQQVEQPNGQLCLIVEDGGEKEDESQEGEGEISKWENWIEEGPGSPDNAPHLQVT